MPRFYLQQFGCRATQADGAAIERQLLDRGCTVADSPTCADVVVLNTCTVTAAADAEARDAIRKIHAQNPSAQIVVTGCYAQRAAEELAALRGVTHVVGNSHKPHIPGLISASVFGASRDASDFVSTGGLLRTSDSSSWNTQQATILTGDIFASTDVLVAPVLGGEGNHTRPILKIQDGCNNRCSFCVIPFVRGKSRSLSSHAILEEIRNLCGGGHNEIVLSGINLGAWGRDFSPRENFIDLLKQILDETPVARLRLSSIEPLDVTRDLSALFASSPRLADHFHMPLQSGSDRILAAMHRWYRTEHYARRVEVIRELLPHAALGADVIAGFPGETDADHAATIDFIASRPFTYLHVFSYSARPGTRAAGLPGQVPTATIKQRARELRALGERKSAEFYRSQCGRLLYALTLRPSESTASSDYTPALSSNYLKLRLPGRFAPNQFVHAICPATSLELAEPSSLSPSCDAVNLFPK